MSETYGRHPLTEHACGKPVSDALPPSPDVVAGAYAVETIGERRKGGDYGVVVHRHRGTVDGGTVVAYLIEYCDTARYRDDVLLPFHGFYNHTIRIERFGPDLSGEATGPRSRLHFRSADRPGNGDVTMWRRVLRGVPHEFTAVAMPDGERRYSVRRYNGYCDDGTPEGRRRAMRFDCAWSRVARWTIRPTG